AELQVGEMAVAVVERRSRIADRGALCRRDPRAGIHEARVRERMAAKEGAPRGGVVLDVDADEGDALAEARRGAGEQRHLPATRRAPRGPVVDDDRVTP